MKLARATPTGSLVADVWQHVAVTWGGKPATTDVHLYVDGDEITAMANSSDGTGTFEPDAANPLTLGNEVDHTRGFGGSIDDVRIYKRVLTAAEIQRTSLTREPRPCYTGNMSIDAVADELLELRTSIPRAGRCSTSAATSCRREAAGRAHRRDVPRAAVPGLRRPRRRRAARATSCATLIRGARRRAARRAAPPGLSRAATTSGSSRSAARPRVRGVHAARPTRSPTASSRTCRSCARRSASICAPRTRAIRRRPASTRSCSATPAPTRSPSTGSRTRCSREGARDRSRG